VTVLTGDSTSVGGVRGEATPPTVECTAARHGTRAAYVAGCRCPDARKANRDYAKYRDRRTAQAAFGSAAPFSVPVADTLSVIEQLRGIGWTLRRIEAEARIGRDHLARIDGRTCRPLRRVRWATHQRLVALLDREPVLAGGRLIDAYQTWQRVHGLIALGYPKVWIARQLGSDRALQLGRYTITARNAEKIRELVDTYGGTLGPSDAARRYAVRHGWTPDLIWQADDHEEFFHTFNNIDSVAVERFVAGDDRVPLNHAEKCCAYKEMLRRGVPRNQVVARLRVSWATAQSFDVESVENRLQYVGGNGQNDNGADQRANADRLLTETPAYPGGRLMPSIAPHDDDSSQRVVA
jgi:hypothetical protein